MKAIKPIKLIDKLKERLDTIERNEEEIQEQHKEMTPEEHQYQAFKKAWYFHSSTTICGVPMAMMDTVAIRTLNAYLSAGTMLKRGEQKMNREKEKEDKKKSNKFF